VTTRRRLDGRPLTRRDRIHRADWQTIRVYLIFAGMVVLVLVSLILAGTGYLKSGAGPCPPGKFCPASWED
jgi:hypothetical protein